MLFRSDMEAKIKRCMERSPENECLNIKEMERKISRVDKGRAQTRDLVTGSSWGERSAYHLTVNTSNWNMNELTLAVAEFIRKWYQITNK